MEEMLQNSTAGFSDVLEKVCPPALLSATYVFSVKGSIFYSFMFLVSALPDALSTSGFSIKIKFHLALGLCLCGRGTDDVVNWDVWDHLEHNLHRLLLETKLPANISQVSLNTNLHFHTLRFHQCIFPGKKEKSNFVYSGCYSCLP